MKSCCLSGFHITNLGKIAQLLEQALGMDLQERDSLYIGQYYHLDNDGEEFILRFNVDPLSKPPEEEWFEEKFKDFPILLYVDCTDRSDEIHQCISSAISDATLLSREDDAEGCAN